jgi:ribosomal protein S18 acetylase RimI-like enzyme
MVAGDIAPVRVLFEQERDVTEYALETLVRDDLIAWVAESEGRIVGAVLTHLMHPENRGAVDELLVARSHRASGLGRRLMDEAEGHYRALGAVGMRLTVREGNASAERLYESLGYRVVQRRLRMERDFAD